MRDTRAIEKVLKIAAFMIAALLLIFVLFSPFFADEHQCTGHHCVICFLSSNVSAICVRTGFVYFVVLTLTAVFVAHCNTNRSETPITLKLKLTN